MRYKTSHHPELATVLKVSNTTNLAQTLNKLCCLLGIKESLAWLKQHGVNPNRLSFIVADANWLSAMAESPYSNLSTPTHIRRVSAFA